MSQHSGSYGIEELSTALIIDTLNILLKFKEDCEKIIDKLNQKDWFSGIWERSSVSN
ncbi:hypothetical protein JCM17380_42410 [Desulfosporosinus burensis]